MGDVRTAVVPEKWRELYEHTETHSACCLDLSQVQELITELASWQARAEQAEKDVARLTLECEASRAYASNVVDHANEYLARAEQAESTIAAWKKDAEDKAVLIAELNWKPITDECLPTQGDELYGPRMGVMIMPEGYPMIPMATNFTFAGWTHFRPLNAPRSTDLEREDGK